MIPEPLRKALVAVGLALASVAPTPAPKRLPGPVGSPAVLRWRSDASLAGVDEATVREEARKALAAWSSVCGITPVEVPRDIKATAPDLIVVHGPIDGPLNPLGMTPTILADCDFPGGYRTQRLWLDESELWSGDEGRAMLRRVLLHEFGHALGLEHIDDVTSIMHGSALASAIDPKSVAEAVRRYGPPAKPR